MPFRLEFELFCAMILLNASASSISGHDRGEVRSNQQRLVYRWYLSAARGSFDGPKGTALEREFFATLRAKRAEVYFPGHTTSSTFCRVYPYKVQSSACQFRRNVLQEGSDPLIIDPSFCGHRRCLDIEVDFRGPQICCQFSI